MTEPMTEETTDAAIRVRDLHKSFATLDTTIVAADGIDLDVAAGTVTSLTGPSGSGKSTLLHLLGALDRPDAGTISVFGEEVSALPAKALPAFRRRVGFVFQRFHLLPTLSVLDNVLAPLLPSRPGHVERDRAARLLAEVGLTDRHHTLATRLSGGQQQRVAIARALVAAPPLLLADEPTGNLDTATGAEIEELILGLPAAHGTTVVLATHDVDLARRCDRTVHLVDGRLAAPPGVTRSERAR